MQAVRTIYDRFSLPCDRSFEEQMGTQLELTRREIAGTHRYRLEDFGVDPEELVAQAPTYWRRFANLCESA